MESAKKLIAVNGRPIKLVVNVSVNQITKKFASIVTTILNELDFAASLLTLELTEHNLIELASDYRLDIVDHFEKMGIKISLEDFGVGYSICLFK